MSSKAEDYRPVWDHRENVKMGKKFFFSILYLPKLLQKVMRTVKPESAFAKKKDAENHVSLLAIKKLYSMGLINDNLYPTLT